MADRADVYVKNVLTDPINVIRKLPDGTSDLDITIANGNEEMIHLPNPEVSLGINVPGVETRDCFITKRSDIDMAVSYSRTDSNWTMNIVPNDLPPEVPLTVNITVGGNEPE